MNERTEIIGSTYTPTLAIIVNRAKNSVTGQGEYYLESHDINEKGQLMQGKPLLQETIQDVVDLFFDERKNMVKIGGMIPENLLSFKTLPGGNYRMVWYRPAEIRVLHFAAQLKLSTGKGWVPAMVYVADRRGLDVYALKTNMRPKETTKLCLAPFFNVNDDGDVCLGNAVVKKPVEKTYGAYMKYWEDLFWLSEFTHTNGDDEKTVTKLHPLWKKLLASKTKLKWSDMKELKFYPKKTLKSIL